MDEVSTRTWTPKVCRRIGFHRFWAILLHTFGVLGMDEWMRVELVQGSRLGFGLWGVFGIDPCSVALRFRVLTAKTPKPSTCTEDPYILPKGPRHCYGGYFSKS